MNTGVATHRLGGRRIRPLACLRAVALTWVALWAAVAFAQDVLPVPALSGRVIDEAAVLTPAQRSALELQLAAIETSVGSQIVVLTLPTTQPEDIAAYAQRVADSWKIGRRQVGDGVLVVVARDDRRVRIEVAKALEGAVPDLAASRIIEATMIPAFEAGDYADGLRAGIEQLRARIAGEALPAPEARRAAAKSGPQLEELAMFFFVAVPVLGALLTAFLGRRLGTLATAGAAGGAAWWLSTSALLAGAAGVIALVLVGAMGSGASRRGGRGRSGIGMIPPIWGGGGRGGGFGGGGFGGGFGSGGGGDFGGGGASGRW